MHQYDPKMTVIMDLDTDSKLDIDVDSELDALTNSIKTQQLFCPEANLNDLLEAIHTSSSLLASQQYADPTLVKAHIQSSKARYREYVRFVKFENTCLQELGKKVYRLLWSDSSSMSDWDFLVLSNQVDNEILVAI